MATAANLVEIITPMPASSRQPKAEQALERARAFAITTQADYITAADALAQVKAEWKEADADRETLKAPSLDGCRRVDAYFKPTLTFLRDAEILLKDKIVAYDKQQEALRREEQRRLDEAARVERERKEAEAREIERKAREKADAERKAAEEQRRVEDAARHEAEEAKRRGDAAAAAEAERAAKAAAASAAKFETRAASTEAKAQEKAATVQAAAASIVAPVIQRSAPAISGLSMRKKWRFRIKDKTAVPEEYKDVNESRLQKVVDALGDQARIAGIEIYADVIPASKAAR